MVFVCEAAACFFCLLVFLYSLARSLSLSLFLLGNVNAIYNSRWASSASAASVGVIVYVTSESSHCNCIGCCGSSTAAAAANQPLKLQQQQKRQQAQHNNTAIANEKKPIALAAAAADFPLARSRCRLRFEAPK